MKKRLKDWDRILHIEASILIVHRNVAAHMFEPISKADLAFPRAFTRRAHRLYAEGHDTVDNVVVVLLEGLDGLLPAHAGLGHDELDVLGLETSVVDLLTIVLLLLLGLGTLDGLALVTLVGVVVAGVVVGGLAGELLGSLGLGLGVEVLNLSLTEDAVLRVSKMFFSQPLGP
jgi:hypothetical protein